jgi:hypothetical protein
MNLRQARVVLRPRDAIGVLDLAAPFCVRNWRVFVPLMGLALVPLFAACLAARYALGWRWPWVWLVAVAFGGLAHAPFTVACGEVLFQGPAQVRLRAIVARVWRRTPPLIITHVLAWVLNALAATVMILLPFSAGALLVVHEAVLLEGAGPFQALARSARAVRGHGASAFGVAFALVLLPVAGVCAGEITLNTLISTGLQLGEPFGKLWDRGGTPYALAGYFLTIPLSAAARFLKYIDLRTRKEGWDIQLRFTAAAQAAKTAKTAKTVGTTAVVQDESAA